MSNSQKTNLESSGGKPSKTMALFRHFFRGAPSFTSQADTPLNDLAYNSSPRKRALVRGVSIRSVRLIWLTFASLFFKRTHRA